MKIILTGIAGFIGSHLARRLLREGHTVIGIDDLNDYYAVSLKRDRLADVASVRAFEFVEADIADLEKMRALFTAHADATHIVHLAAQAGVRYSIERPELYVHANVMGQVAIFEAARKLDRCRHLVYASTSSVYGANKLAGEHIAYTYGHLHGLPATGFRFFTVYGPWGRPDMSYYKFASAITADEPIAVHGFGEMSRDFTYVDDVVSCLVAAIERPPAPDATGVRHKIYNIGNNQPTPLLEFIAFIERSLGRKAKRSLVPVQPGEMVSTYADIAETQRDFGFQPSTPVALGIEEFARWFKSYHRVN